MDSSLHEVWQAAAGSPFLPTVGKNTQFLVGFILLLLGISVTSVFALSESPDEPVPRVREGHLELIVNRPVSRQRPAAGSPGISGNCVRSLS